MLYDIVALNEIEDITVDQIRDYALQQGWQSVASHRADVLLMRRPDLKVSEIALPLSKEFADYLDAVAIAVSRLAIYLERPASSVVHDIVSTNNPLTLIQKQGQREKELQEQTHGT